MFLNYNYFLEKYKLLSEYYNCQIMNDGFYIRFFQNFSALVKDSIKIVTF